MDAMEENLLRRFCVGDLVTRSARRYGERVALVAGDRQVSYRELNEQACRAANAFLAIGVQRGDRVAFLTHNSLEYIYCRLGLLKIGGVAVPINFMLQPDEIAYIVGDAEPVAFFVEDSLANRVQAAANRFKSVRHYGWFDFGGGLERPAGWRDAATFIAHAGADEPRVRVESDDLASLLYTSGTESFPKGVMATHANCFAAIHVNAIDMGLSRDDVVLLDIPLFHVAGTMSLFGVFAVGARASIGYAPNPVATLERTQRERATVWVYPPTLYQALPMMPTFAATDLSSLKKCVSFGAVMPVAILERWNAIRPGLEWRNYWGQTESNPLGSVSLPETFQEKIASIGLPSSGATVAVVDDAGHELPPGVEGELVIRGPSVMQGYWRRPELSAAAFAGGWLHTGDIGYRDETGHIFFTDRKKDMIKTGGENVASQEVEGVLTRNPKVALAAVVGMPHPHWIEAVGAYVVLKPGQTADEDEIVAYCKEHLAGYKVPKRVFFLPEMPVSATGKILKRVLRDRAKEEAAAA